MQNKTIGQSKKVISSSLILFSVITGTFLAARKLSTQVAWSTTADTTSNVESGTEKAASEKTPVADAGNAKAASTAADAADAVRPGLPGSMTVARKTDPEDADALFEKYTATAYCDKGNTRVGLPAIVGIIAADPRVLPLGTIVQIKAGRFTGKYLVSDTGGKILGRRVDIYVTTRQEAVLFGRQTIQLRVLGRYTKVLGRYTNKPASGTRGSGTRLLELSQNDSVTKPISMLRQPSEENPE